MKTSPLPCILTIAGSDSGGGAGIQADLKTAAALGGYACTAVTAITVQNTQGVTDIYPVPATIVAGQIHAVMDDLRPAAIKTGMIPNADVAQVIAQALTAYPHIPVVIDPVIRSGTGRRLMDDPVKDILRHSLFPLATLVTPNTDEAAALTGYPVNTVTDMERAARQLLRAGCQAVLVKGGHLPGATIDHVLATADGEVLRISTPRIDSPHLHGTGCTLSAAIAILLAGKKSLYEAVTLAINFVQQAIEHGRELHIGKGSGPLHHFFHLQQPIRYGS